MKKITVHLLMLLCGLPLFSQYDMVDSLLIDLFGNDREISQLFGQSKHGFYLYSGFNAENKTFYAGREVGDNMYAANGNIYLFHSKGFYIGASGSWYRDLKPAYNSTIVTAGIRKYLNRKQNLSLRISYSRYFFNVSDSSEVIFSNNLGAGLTLRNSWIGGRLSFNALFGNDFGMNLTPEVFANITLARFGGSSKIMFTPDLSLFVGSETIEYESTGSMIDPLVPTSFYTADKYGLLNTQIYLPVCIYAGNLDLEIGWSFNIPRTQDNTISYPVNSFFSVSIGYLLPFN